MRLTLVTSNQDKAKYFANLIGMEIDHADIDLDEIQSLDLEEIVRHKVIQAYQIIQKPVVVEDVSLELEAFGGKLPGPFIKFFLQELSAQDICNLVNGRSRRAVAHSVLGYYDGKNLKMFEGKLPGVIAKSPAGDNGFGFDKFLIPDGYNITRAQMNEIDDRKTYLKIKRLDLLREFLNGQDNREAF